MKATLKAALIAALPALAGCAGGFPLADPMMRAGALCAAVREADAAWQAGCATAHNLAVTAENAGDLYVPRPETPRDAMRRDGLFRSYARPGAQAAAPPGSATAAQGGPL